MTYLASLARFWRDNCKVSFIMCKISPIQRDFGDLLNLLVFQSFCAAPNGAGNRVGD